MKNISPLLLAMALSGRLFASTKNDEYRQCHKSGCWAFGKKGDPYEKTCKACKYFINEEHK